MRAKTAHRRNFFFLLQSTKLLIDLIFGMHTPIRSIDVVGYMNLTFEVIKGHLWEIFIIFEG